LPDANAVHHSRTPPIAIATTVIGSPNNPRTLVTLLGKRSITDADERRLLELLAASADGSAYALLTAKAATGFEMIGSMEVDDAA
jgi:hypothetical protein